MKSFDDLLSDPHEQFDLRSELLASIAAFANAPCDTASSVPRPQHQVWLHAAESDTPPSQALGSPS